MQRIIPFALGVAAGLIVSFFTSLLTEFFLGVVIVVVLVLYGRKRWSTHSTTKPSQSSSPSPTDLL